TITNLSDTNCLEIQGASLGADKVVRTEVQQTFVNGLLGFVTLGIYTPREARVYCAK
ncbi:lipoprotein bor domain protein, partial [Klebsiella sp. AS10]|uniref:Bor family protein n=1 Tax=Klebsiella sp. AS10 TaxID=936564 RepID=UPI0004505B9E